MSIVAVLGVWLWHSTKALDPYAPLSSNQPPLRVEVVGYDWKWLFIYPDLKIASIRQFAFPADRPLAIELTSDTVMQSFLIPALGSQSTRCPAWSHSFICRRLPRQLSRREHAIQTAPDSTSKNSRQGQ